jgi:phospholipase/carboxylesterase
VDGALSPSRRRFLELTLRTAAWAPVVSLASACFQDATWPDATGHGGSGVLATRWRSPTTTLTPGLHPLGLGSTRDGYIRVPAGYQPDVPAPLALLLHGAGGDAMDWSGIFPVFDELGVVALAVDSRAPSWDLSYGYFGADVSFIDRALARVFDGCNVDADRMAISGFSDGASYALSLGLTNGVFFTHVLAFSPGFIDTGERTGKPAIFLAHGTADTVLPVSFTRTLATQLRSGGYEVILQEFAGGHVVPEAVAEAGYAWVAGKRPG